jgi:hypothetical protein
VAVIDSPRGKWTMSESHNPVQNNDLREASNKENKMIGIARRQSAGRFRRVAACELFSYSMFQGPLETTPTADGHPPFFYASRFVELYMM